MAITWGPWESTGTQSARVGIDRGWTGDPASGSVEAWAEYWVEHSQAVNQQQTLLRAGAISGSVPFQAVRGAVRVGRWSVGQATAYNAPRVIQFAAEVSGHYAGLTPSVTVSLTIPERPSASRPPAPPWATATFIADGHLRVEWGHPAVINDPAYAIDGVQIERWDSATGKWFRVANLSGKPTSYSDRGTASNRAYQYRVRLTSTRTGTGAFAHTDNVFTTPAQPTGVRAVPSSAGVLVTWTNVARHASAVEIERQEDGGAWISAGLNFGGARSDWTHTDADPAKRHRYRVRTRRDGTPTLRSAYGTSNEVALAAPPDAPTGLGPSSRWDATEDHVWTWRHVPTDGSPQERFQIRHRVSGSSVWTETSEVASSVPQWTLPGGTYANGQVVEWQVRTWGLHPDPSPWSGSRFDRPLARPTVAITTPTDGQVIDRSSVTVEWTFQQEQSYAQAAWRVELVQEGQVVRTLTGGGSDAGQVVLDGLQNDTDYTIRVSSSAMGLWSVPDAVGIHVEFVRPAAPTVLVSWDVNLGAAVVQLEQPAWMAGTAEPAYHQVWRAIDDGPWLLIADQVPLGTAVTDPIPVIGDGTVNYYRARTVSVLPSTADAPVVPLAVSTRDTHGWVYLNGGPGMTQVCRVRANAQRNDDEGAERVLRQFAERKSPVAYTGTAVPLDWDVSAKIAPNYDGASTRAELVALQVEHGDAICYRDPVPTAPARWFGNMGRVASSWRTVVGEASWSMTRVHYTEGLAREEVTAQ